MTPEGPRRAAVRVCHLSSVHRADDPRILAKECATLAEAGYDVRLIAPTPLVDTASGVRHVTVPRRSGRFSRLLRTVPAVLRAARQQDAAIYHLHDPELLPIGLLLRHRGRAVIYDAHEDLGNQVRHKPWIPRWLRPGVARLASGVERLVARQLSAVVAATPPVAAHFPSDRTVVIRNLARSEEFAAAGEAMAYVDRDRIAAYVGNVSAPRGAREMIEAMDAVGASTARLRIAGDFSPSSLRDELESLPGWARVDPLGWQDRLGVARLLGGARLGLVCLHPTPSYVESYPVKLFEYMAAGLPVIASDFPLWRSIVDDAGCGLLVDPLDPAAIAAAIDTLLDDPAEAEAMGRRGRDAVLRRWSWQPEGQRLVELYDRLAGISGSPPGP